MGMGTAGGLRPITIALCFSALNACGGGGDGDGGSTGTLSLGLSDTPVHEASKVCISFTAIELKHAGSPNTVISLDPPARVNLLEYQGAAVAPLLVNETLEAGDYQWIRLAVDAERGDDGGAGDTGGAGCDGAGSYLVTPEGTFNLYVPSGAETGLKLVRGFTVPVNDHADFTIEFDLMKSVTMPAGHEGEAILKPALRLVDNVEAGTLTGTVDAALAGQPECAPAVYVFAQGVLPNEIDGGDEDPVATALVAMDEEGIFGYVVGFLTAGDYNVAFTCDADTDAAGDVVEFTPPAGKPVTILAGGIATVDFP
jgi:hypothetical protein